MLVDIQRIQLAPNVAYMYLESAIESVDRSELWLALKVIWTPQVLLGLLMTFISILVPEEEWKHPSL